MSVRPLVCRRCGKPFAPETVSQTMCPACRLDARRASYRRERTCQDCGQPFIGVPRQRRCPRCQAAAEAAAERARKEAEEQRAKYPIGKAGDWKSLGLLPGKDLQAVPAEPKIAAAEALERLRRGETVTDPLGRDIRFGLDAEKHIDKKGRDAEELKLRLQSLNRAEATVRDPLEIWRDPDNGREKYIRLIRQGNGEDGIECGHRKRIDYLLVALKCGVA